MKHLLVKQLHNLDYSENMMAMHSVMMGNMETSTVQVNLEILALETKMGTFLKRRSVPTVRNLDHLASFH